jgi:hypothetical protein
MVSIGGEFGGTQSRRGDKLWQREYTNTIMGFDVQPQIWLFPEFCLRRKFDVRSGIPQRREESIYQSHIFLHA